MSTPYIGEIKTVAFNFPPRGFVSCAGQIMSISQNTALFSLLGTTYGGNGQNTFGLPNLQGRVAVGQGQSPGTSIYQLGEVAGTETVTLTSLQMPMHTHAATNTAQTISSPATLSGDISIPAQSGGAATNTPGTTVVLGKPGSPLYANASNTTLAPFTATLTGSASVAIPANSLGIQNGSAGGSQPFAILQPFLVINYVIATAGIFPSRN